MPDILSTFTKYAPGSQTTTNSYVDYFTAWDKSGYRFASLVVTNTGVTNSAHFKILGSVDGGSTYPVTIYPTQILAQNTFLELQICKFYTHVKVQIKAASGGNQTTVTVLGVAAK